MKKVLGLFLVTAFLNATACSRPDTATPRTHTVEISGMKYVPEALEVRAGDTIRWHNADMFPHTATAAGVFDTGEIKADSSASVVVGASAKVDYICTYHPTMKASVTVSE